GDVRLEAAATGDGVRYRLALGGTAHSAAVLGWVTAEAAVPAVLAVLERFHELRQATAEPPRRLAEAVARFGTEPFAAVPGLEPLAGPDPIAQRPATVADDTLGRDPRGAWLGAAFPFGALSAEQLEALAGVIEPGSGGTLRITPWRAVLITGAGAGAEARLQGAGAILDAGDPRLAVSACIGAPGCDAAAAATRVDAPEMTEAAAGLLARGGRLHLSGCPKGCGEPAAASVVLTADEAGYRLAVSDGTTWGPLQEGLTPEAARRGLAGLTRVVANEQQPGERVDETVKRLGRPALAARIGEEIDHDG
ncbi:MAG TPA: precorrin-3B synthase, partial [Gammaproteobacteria bacterium]|nr:precorrin-3B synthase [Gammaproteobacteria bacterium]